MENKLTVFTNEQFGKVRGINFEGESWLVGKDVVEALGYNKKYYDVIKQHCDEDDYILYDSKTQPQNGAEFNYKELGQRGGYLINESGMYALVFGSELPDAKKFKKWVTSEVLPQIRKTGGMVVEGREEEFINNYFPSFSEEVKKAMTLDLYHRNQEYKKQLETQNKLIKFQQETIEVQVKEIEHKEDTIIDLTKGINIAEKRQRITQIVRYRAKGNYQERYNLLYREFNAKFHVDVQRRLKNGKENGTIKKSVNVMEYICSEKYLNMTNELYDLCVVVFEADFIELLEEWKDTINK